MGKSGNTTECAVETPKRVKVGGSSFVSEKRADYLRFHHFNMRAQDGTEVGRILLTATGGSCLIKKMYIDTRISIKWKIELKTGSGVARSHKRHRGTEPVMWKMLTHKKRLYINMSNSLNISYTKNDEMETESNDDEDEDDDREMEREREREREEKERERDRNAAESFDMVDLKGCVVGKIDRECISMAEMRRLGLLSIQKKSFRWQITVYDAGESRFDKEYRAYDKECAPCYSVPLWVDVSDDKEAVKTARRRDDLDTVEIAIGYDC